MFRTLLAIITVASLAGFAFSQGKSTDSSAADAKLLEGLWSGSWGGGRNGDGVVFQPVLARAVISGNRIEVSGFRTIGNLAGTFRLDSRRQEMHITPAGKAQNQSPAKVITYKYELKQDQMTLTDSDQVPIGLSREPLARNPLANVQVEFAVASGINTAGDLLVTDHNWVEAGRAKETVYVPRKRILKLKSAAIFVVQDADCKRSSVAAVRESLRESTPVILAFRNEIAPPASDGHELWNERGAAAPDSDAALKMFASLVKPGTFVFVLSPVENAPVP
jgi:hypothetical protein